MKTTVEYLDAVKRKSGITSNYALAKRLEMSETGIGNLYRGRSGMSIETAMKVGEILGIDSHIIYGDGQVEHAKSPSAKAFWTGLSEKFSVSFLNLLSGAGPRRDLISTC
jgi:DNA-binding XRE family transcriptional regulator